MKLGLITYRETAMLFDPKESSDQNKIRVATGINFVSFTERTIQES